MSRRRNPYYVQIPQNKAPQGLSVCETLRELDRLIEKYIRKHKGHQLTTPLLPEVTLSLSSGKEIHGVLKQVSDNAVEMYPIRVLWTTRELGGEQKHKGPDYEKVSVADISVVVAVEYCFNKRKVDPNSLK